MEQYTNTFEVSLTHEEYESKYNKQSFLFAKAFIESFKASFPGTILGQTRNRFVEIDGGLKFIVDINSDVTPLEMAAKQVELALSLSNSLARRGFTVVNAFDATGLPTIQIGAGTAGTANTGGGGGASEPGQAGGSGIVIIRYLSP